MSALNLQWHSDFESSQLSAYAYDPEAKVLAIRFVSTGSEYHYYHVPQATFDGLHQAESKGSFFIRNIKRAPFRYQRQSPQFEKPVCPPNP